MRTRSSTRGRLVASLLASFVLLTVAPTAAQTPSGKSKDKFQGYDAALHTYRAGDIDGALAQLDAALRADSGTLDLSAWMTSDRPGLRSDLEAVLMLHTETVLKFWLIDVPFVVTPPQRYVSPVLRLHSALKNIDPASPFLRSWYLLWEAMVQGLAADSGYLDQLDFLDDALAAFPADSQLLLAAGSRHELLWSVRPDNPHRDPSGDASSSPGSLRRARDYFRRSLAADPAEAEARLRLAHVLTEMGSYQEGLDVITAVEWNKAEPVFEYLGRLFEGTLHERLGDPAAANGAYDRAILLIKVPQSARVAKAYLAHHTGARPAAADEILKALSLPREEADPWWLFIRGQQWRRTGYLDRARAMVRPALTPPVGPPVVK